MSSLTIKDFYPKHKKMKGDIGLELEIEFNAKETPILENVGAWRPVHDDSLRNGMEYITRAPLKIGDEFHEKVKVMTDELNKKKVELSHRCSVHVHRNVLDFTPIEVLNTLLAYWIIEAPLLNFCGKNRRKNLFCVGVNEANGVISMLCSSILEDKIPLEFSEERCKYGGQNLNAISRLGSIEYRGMRGSTDPDLITLWATTLYELGERARKFSDPAALMDFYLDSEKDQFLQTMLPAEFINHIAETQDYVSLINANVEHLIPLAYCVEDWKAWEDGLTVNPPKKTIFVASLAAVAAALNDIPVIEEEFEDD